jgi:Protein of unknown function (DUF992)
VRQSPRLLSPCFRQDQWCQLLQPRASKPAYLPARWPADLDGFSAPPRTIECKFEPGHGHIEEYTGTVSTFGIDFGYLGTCAIVWAVVAPNSSAGPGALAGTYFGASAQAAALVGGGVSIMTGGFRNSVALQPVSVMGNTGLYVGGGIASISLELADY